LEAGGGIQAKLETMGKAGFAVCPSLESVADAVKKALE
jgi:hypothetical protein